MPPKFIADRIEYEKFGSRLRTLVNPDRCLPDNVFKKDFHRYYFISFDWILDEAVLELIKELSNVFKDEVIDLWAPAQEDVFPRNYGYYPALSFSAMRVTGSEYTEAIVYDPDPVGMSIQFQSEVLVVSGSSSDWVIWGDRKFELAVIAVSKEISAFNVGKLGFLQFTDIEGALNLTSARFPNQIVPPDIKERFEKNYASKSLFRMGDF